MSAKVVLLDSHAATVYSFCIGLNFIENTWNFILCSRIFNVQLKCRKICEYRCSHISIPKVDRILLIVFGIVICCMREELKFYLEEYFDEK